MNSKITKFQKITKNLKDSMTQCADEKSNESVEDMDRTFTGW